MIAIRYRSASRIASADFPPPVGPQMTRIPRMVTARRSSAPEATLDFVPGEMNDRRATVNVVRRQLGIAERREQRAHLALRKLLPGFDRGLASNCRGEPLVTRGGAGDAISRQRVEGFPKTALGVEPRVRHRDG